MLKKLLVFVIKLYPVFIYQNVVNIIVIEDRVCDKPGSKESDKSIPRVLFLLFIDSSIAALAKKLYCLSFII